MLDESDEIDDLDDDDIADPDIFPQPVNQREAIVDSSESESDEEDEDNSVADTLTSLSRKKRTKRVHWKKRPLNQRDCSWQSAQNDTADEDDLRNLPKPYNLFNEYFSNKIMVLLTEKTNQYVVHQNGKSLHTNANEIEMLMKKFYWVSISRWVHRISHD